MSRQPLTLKGATLHCSLLRPPPARQVEVNENSDPKQVMLSKLPVSYTDEQLSEYLNKATAGSASVSRLTRLPQDSTALAQFKLAPG